MRGPAYTISNNYKIGYVSEDVQQKTMTIIDETATISSTKKIKQVFSPRQSFPPKPYVEVPSPFILDIEEFMPKKFGGNKTSNAFIIYRTVFAKVLMGKDYQSKMTDVSKWAAISWKNEKADVKTAYKKFAKEIQRIHKKRSQDALISRNRRLIAATAPISENQTSIPIPIPSQINPPRNEVQTYQPNLIVEQVPTIFPYHFPIQQNFISELSDKELQVNNNSLNLMTTFGYDQFPIPSSIEEEFFIGQDELLNRDLEAQNLAVPSFLMHSILQPPPQEIYSEFCENNEPGWVYYGP